MAKPVILMASHVSEPFGSPGLRQYDAREASRLSAYDPPPADHTYQVQRHLKDEVDINTIVRRFGLGNLPPQVAGVYGDFTGIEDYSDAVAKIEKAHDAFARLPAEVRERFHNDPQELVRFASHANEEEFKTAMAYDLPAPTDKAVVDMIADRLVERMRATENPTP